MSLLQSAFFRANTSFFVMALSSLLYFMATFLAKKTMIEEDFYYWNVLLTISAISYSFCFLGSEQLFLRFGMVHGKDYHVPKTIIKAMGWSFVLYLFGFSILTNTVLFRVNDYYLTALVGILSASSVFVYNFLRVTKLFTASQIVNNFWKIALFVAVLVAAGSNVKEILYITLTLCTFVGLWSLSVVFRKLKITDKYTGNTKSLFLSFAFSLLVLVLLNNFDRVLIEKVFSKEEFSDYIYLLSLLIMPFSIISSYIGFKEVAELKKRYVKSQFNKKVLLVGVTLSIVFTVWFLTLVCLREYLELPIKFSYFIPCITIVIVKSIYALYSSLFGLKGTARQIQISNLITVISVVFSIVVSYPLIIGQPTLVLYSVAAVWLTRIFVYAYFVRHQPEYQL
ncbi:polysaccharide biosynthesis protein [Catenovulum agarivorans DS-2]|uniref:Polysaccharide biosynthesis protein n=1 Tax=Catenovulum agarivorans DS-2 TaxID=1328313 RepID=W7QK57_9ALTE|nr:hypothetical protein [Catenovulum agarivorans]EWH08498.1 polysaccharide biosynthesis protein [Catenovulum agarivorans DS-2]